MEGEEVLLLTIRIIMKCANIDDQKIVELVDWHESGQDNPTDNAMVIYHKYKAQCQLLGDMRLMIPPFSNISQSCYIWHLVAPSPKINK